MTINFPFPLIKSNSPSDSVWHWDASGRVCNSAVLHAGWTLSFCRGGTQTSPMKPLGEKNTAGRQFVGLGETRTHGEAPGAGLELDGSAGKDGGSPGAGKSSAVSFQRAACTRR